ncbi:vWA domain-containing protein [Planctomycetes bacterium K23_9]|uniref:VWFA domain-containing protein n=1 Tax=Stieleria marina TaxID=1930275 RepID=A0A517NWH6_9BACT|nr:hypothetical protein K239x_34750 [Planctomycetes bacterium K23_9]
MSNEGSRWRNDSDKEPASGSPVRPPRKSSPPRKSTPPRESSPPVESLPVPSAPLPPPLPESAQTTGDEIFHREPPPVVRTQRAQRRRTQRAAKKTSASTHVSKRGLSATDASPSLFRLDVGEQENHGRRESTSWFSSVAIHLIILAIIGLFLVPADFGGDGMHQLIVTLGDDREAAVGADFATDTVPDDTVTESIPEVKPTFSESAKPAVDRSAKQGGKKAGKGSDKGGQKGLSGSFFGIETTGHEFVYILDMSGSMRGSRYRRASDELIRSVNQLGDGQKFYVILFSNSFIQMFNQNTKAPRAIAATPDNKQRLAEWVVSAFQGGGTDPRGAVKLALQMRPSAIFMLSDGKFRKPSVNSKSSRTFLSDNLDVFQLAQAAGGRTPIQAIAFEEAVACENMKKLSLLTGGKYRFVGNQDSDQAQEMLDDASDAMKTGQLESAEYLMTRLIKAYGNTEPAWQAREKLARMLFERSHDSLKKDDITAAGKSIEQLIEIDPNAIVTESYQVPLVNQLIKLTNDDPGSQQSQAASVVLGSLLKRFPQSQFRQDMDKVLVNKTLTETRALLANNKPIEAFVKIDRCVTQMPFVRHDEDIKTLHRNIADRLIERARLIQQSQGDEAYLTHLTNLSRATKQTSLQKRIVPLLAKLAGSMVRGSRVGLDEKAKEARRKLAQQIAHEIGNPQLIKEVQRESLQGEMRARSMLRTAQRVERMGDAVGAMKRYSILVKGYPDTVAAKAARSRYWKLRQQTAAADDDGSLALQKMIKDANSAKPSR